MELMVTLFLETEEGNAGPRGVNRVIHYVIRVTFHRSSSTLKSGITVKRSTIRSVTIN